MYPNVHYHADVRRAATARLIATAARLIATAARLITARSAGAGLFREREIATAMIVVWR